MRNTRAKTVYVIICLCSELLKWGKDANIFHALTALFSRKTANKRRVCRAVTDWLCGMKHPAVAITCHRSLAPHQRQSDGSMTAQNFVSIRYPDTRCIPLKCMSHCMTCPYWPAGLETNNSRRTHRKLLREDRSFPRACKRIDTPSAAAGIARLKRHLSSRGLRQKHKGDQPAHSLKPKACPPRPARTPFAAQNTQILALLVVFCDIH